MLEIASLVASWLSFDAYEQLLSVRRRLHRASKKNDALELTVSMLKEEGAGLRREIAEGVEKRGDATCEWPTKKPATNETDDLSVAVTVCQRSPRKKGET